MVLSSFVCANRRGMPLHNSPLLEYEIADSRSEE